jgi:hypothetical protein
MADGVRITFQHSIEADKTKLNALRRVSDICNKRPIRTALESSVCVYWDTRNLYVIVKLILHTAARTDINNYSHLNELFRKWSTDGCKLIKSQRFQSICECSHLTSFALLMDLHKHSVSKLIVIL